MIIVAEIGINHNGDLKLACKMMEVAKAAGCDLVKFQKRTIDKVYTKEELDRPRESPWGKTNREQKEGLELSKYDYSYIDRRSKELGIPWFASPWDVDSVDFLMRFDVPFMKVAGACVTDLELLKKIAETGKPIILSTGMSTKEEVREALRFFQGQVKYVLACTSTYPTPVDELNLKFISTLRKWKGSSWEVGYSNHSPGVAPCIAAAALGAEMIEFHMTLDRSMYGSDQAASIEPPGMFNLVKNCRNMEKALGNGEWMVFPSEEKVKAKLRKR
jgi:N-acetylneuraminate synthase